MWCKVGEGAHRARGRSGGWKCWEVCVGKGAQCEGGVEDKGCESEGKRSTEQREHEEEKCGGIGGGAVAPALTWTLTWAGARTITTSWPGRV